MAILAFETSCDETSVAVVRDGVVLSNIVSSQIQVHAEYGGVVPELASRMHLRNLHTVAARALSEAGVAAADLYAVAATQGPGLPNALMAGMGAGQGVALALGVPFVPIHHHEAHLYSPWICGQPLRLDMQAFVPHVSLIVSGGHTMLVHVHGILEHEVLGMTVDDAAGECFDKVAKLMGLPYPGGVYLDRLARGGRGDAIDFPRPMLSSGDFDFSFSGLKTAVRYHLRDHPEVLSTEPLLRDLCASVQSAIVEVLSRKSLEACRAKRVGALTVSGGVAANSGLREALSRGCARRGLALRLADRGLCGDNAAMVGVLAELRLNRARIPDFEAWALDHEPRPRWGLAEVSNARGERSGAQG